MKKLLVNIVIFYFRFFAKLAIQINRPIIIGITGSVGKSSARNIIAGILKDHFSIKVIEGNSEIGLPLGILGLKLQSLGFATPFASLMDWLKLFIFAPFSVNYLKGTRYLIAEMGVDDPYPPKNMDYLLTFIKPDIALLLNVAAVHTEQFAKLLKKENLTFSDDSEKKDWLMNRIALEKAKIIYKSGCKIGIFNSDNAYVQKAISTSKNPPLKMLSFGKENGNDLKYGDYSVSLSGTRFSFILPDAGTFPLDIKNYLLPKNYQETFAAAILASRETGLTVPKIIDSLIKNFHLPPGRATMLPSIKNGIIIDSSYNASLTSVISMLDLLKDLKTQTGKAAAFLMGDMRELGDLAKLEHEAVAEKMNGIVDHLYLVGPLTKSYLLAYPHPIQKSVKWFPDSDKAGEYLKKHLPDSCLLLVKGSQNTIFLEEAIKYLLADPLDGQKLCRQENYWLSKKRIKTSLQTPS